MRTGKPLYMTIVSDLKKLIFTGERNPGDMLRSENELALQYKIPGMYEGTAKIVIIGKNLNERLINRLFMEV